MARHILFIVILLLITASIAVVIVVSTTNILPSTSNNNPAVPNSEMTSPNGLVIQPDSYNFFQIKNPTNRLYIEINSGNMTTLQPMVLNNTSFSLYQQGKPYQPSIGSNSFVKDLVANRFVYNDFIDMGNYVLIKNNDMNNASNVTIVLFITVPVP
jgi:archaellum component FlaG (FlaF/FlaG flagellin family)